MGLSLSLLTSAWEEILSHSYLLLPLDLPLNSPRKGLILKTDPDTPSKKSNDSSDNTKTTRRMNSITLKHCEPLKVMLETTLSFKNLVQEIKKPETSELSLKTDHAVSANLLPEPPVYFSPRPVTELNAAATTLQKVYKSYRTRRNLADCAVVAEELWWKVLDSAALKRSSVSFFNVEKPETAMSRWARARTRAAIVGKGLSKNEKAQILALQHWLEAIDPRHRYGHNLHMYYDIWFESQSCQPFFYWLDVGDGKEVNIEKCPRAQLQRQCIKYLGPNEREEYEVIVEDGKLVYKQSGLLLETVEGSKWIFVLSTSRNLYIGQKKKGLFQHSSFLSGGVTTAAGRLVAHGGVLEAIWPYSGHYLPTEENFREFILFLEENHVDLTNVKRCAVDDDDVSFSFKVPAPENQINDVSFSFKVSAPENQIKPKPLVIPRPRPVDILHTPTQQLMAHRMSCKWSSGTGPRIGCVRDYPAELQSRALEQVNLSPRIGPANYESYGPIPSPRPSPMVRLSPRLSCMGLPSPRTPIAASG